MVQCSNICTLCKGSEGHWYKPSLTVCIEEVFKKKVDKQIAYIRMKGNNCSQEIQRTRVRIRYLKINRRLLSEVPLKGKATFTIKSELMYCCGALSKWSSCIAETKGYWEQKERKKNNNS